jgi:hypothetical protein
MPVLADPRLVIWRLVRRILQHPPPFELRCSLGPKFIAARAGGDQAYNRSTFPPAPSYIAADVQGNFSRVHARSLAGWCTELGLVRVLVVGGGVRGMLGGGRFL